MLQDYKTKDGLASLKAEISRLEREIAEARQVQAPKAKNAPVPKQEDAELQQECPVCYTKPDQVYTCR